MQLEIKFKKINKSVLNFMQIYIKKKLKKQKNPDFIKQCNWKVKYNA